MNLYELTGDILSLQDMLASSEGDDEELTQALRDTLEANQGEYEAKLEQYCKVIKNLEADAEACNNEAKRLTDKSKHLKASVTRLKAVMYDSMKTTKTTKIKGAIFTVSIQKNGGKLPVIVDVPTDQLPDDLVKVVESPDLDAIAKLLERGSSPLAHFGERGESIRIK